MGRAAPVPAALFAKGARVILHLYMARRFLRSLLGVLAIFFVLTLLIDVVEQARRHGDTLSGLGALVSLSLLNLPQGLYRILPLVFILATLAHFLGLARTSEMVVVRAAGRSAVVALVPPVLVTLVVGGLGVAMFNPLVAATSRAYEERIGEITGEESVLALAGDGLWLRQGGPTGQTVIHAAGANLDGTDLADVTFLGFGPDGSLLRRIDAETAVLSNGVWQLSAAKLWPLAGAGNPEAEARTHPMLTLPSDLTADEIRNSFGTPSSISIWDLPAFIDQLREAGFSALRHEVFLQTELALPVFLVAMVLIGAAFTLRHQRSGRTGLFILSAVLLSFSAYFLRNFAQILGENGEIPVLLAAWAPPFAAIGLAAGLILHLEDG